MASSVADVKGAEEAGCVQKVQQVDDSFAVREATAAGEKKKWRVPQDQIDFILSMDVSDYVFATPDDMDDMPISDEEKAGEKRKHRVAVMQKSRSTKRKMQEWVKAELEKHGYVEIETTAEMLEKHQLEEYIDGQIA